MRVGRKDERYCCQLYKRKDAPFNHPANNAVRGRRGAMPPKELHQVLFVDVQNELNKKEQIDRGEGQQHKRIFET